MNGNYCIRCGSTTKKLIHHHEKYLEIHGYDKVIMMCISCHNKLHMRLRRENTCNIPVEKLSKISRTANKRRPEIKKHQRQYREGHQEEQKQYRKRNIFRNEFNERMMPNVQLREQIIYNYKTGHVCVSSHFQGNCGKKLFYIDIGN